MRMHNRVRKVAHNHVAFADCQCRHSLDFLRANGAALRLVTQWAQNAALVATATFDYRDALPDALVVLIKHQTIGDEGKRVHQFCMLDGCT
eukprot:4525572-Prymnesium_polylepis.1